MHKFGVILSFLFSLSAYSAETAFSEVCKGDGDLPLSKHPDTWSPFDPDTNPSVVRANRPADPKRFANPRGGTSDGEAWEKKEKVRKEYILTKTGQREHIASFYVRMGIALRCPKDAPISIKLNKEIAEDLPQAASRKNYDPFLGGLPLAKLTDENVRKALGKMIEERARGIQGEIIAGRSREDFASHGDTGGKREFSGETSTTAAVDSLVKAIAQKLSESREGKKVELSPDEMSMLAFFDGPKERRLRVAESYLGPVQAEYYRMLLRGDDAKMRPKSDGSLESTLASGAGAKLEPKDGKLELNNEKDVQRFIAQASSPNGQSLLVHRLNIETKEGREAMRNAALRTLSQLKKNGAKDWKSYVAIEAATMKVLEAIDRTAFESPEVTPSNEIQVDLSYAERLANERKARDMGATVLMKNGRGAAPTMEQAIAQIETEVQAIANGIAEEHGKGLTPEMRNALFSLPPVYRKMLVEDIRQMKERKGLRPWQKNALVKTIHNPTLDNVIDYFTGKGNGSSAAKNADRIVKQIDETLAHMGTRPHAKQRFDWLKPDQVEEVVDWAGERLARKDLTPDETMALTTLIGMSQEFGHEGKDQKRVRALRGGNLRYHPDKVLQTHQEEKKARMEAPEISSPLVDRWRKEMHQKGRVLPRTSSLALYNLTESQMKMLNYLEEEMKKNSMEKEFEELLMTGSPEFVEALFIQHFPEMYHMLLKRGLISAVQYDMPGQRLSAEKGLFEKLTAAAVDEALKGKTTDVSEDLKQIIELAVDRELAEKMNMSPEKFLAEVTAYKTRAQHGQASEQELAFLQQLPDHIKAIEDRLKVELPRGIAAAAAKKVLETDPEKATKLMALAYPDDESRQKAEIRELNAARNFSARFGRELGDFIEADEKKNGRFTSRNFAAVNPTDGSEMTPEVLKSIDAIKVARDKEAAEIARLDREMTLRHQGEQLDFQRQRDQEMRLGEEAKGRYEKAKADYDAAIRRGPPTGRGAGDPKVWRANLDRKLAEAKVGYFDPEASQKEWDSISSRQVAERETLDTRTSEFAQSATEIAMGDQALQGFNTQLEARRMAEGFVRQRIKTDDPKTQEAAIARTTEAILNFAHHEAEVDRAARAVQRRGDGSHRGQPNDLASDLFRSIEGDMTSGKHGFQIGAGAAARIALEADGKEIKARADRDKEVAKIMEKLTPMGARWIGNDLDLSSAKLWMLSEGRVPGKINEGFTGKLTSRANAMIQAMRDLKKFTGEDEYDALIQSVRTGSMASGQQNMFELAGNKLSVATLSENELAAEQSALTTAKESGGTHQVRAHDNFVVFHERKKISEQAQAAYDRIYQMTPKLGEHGVRTGSKNEIEELLEQRGKYGHAFGSVLDRTLAARALGFTTVTDAKGNNILDARQNALINEYLTNIDILYQSGAVEIKYPDGGRGTADREISISRDMAKRYLALDNETTAKIHGQLDTTREIVIHGAIAAATMGTSAYIQSAMAAGRFANVARGLKVIADGGKLSEAGLTRGAIIGTRVVQGVHKGAIAAKSGIHAAEGIVAAEMIGAAGANAYQAAQHYRYKNDGFGGWLRPDKDAELPSYLDRDHDGKIDDHYHAHWKTADEYLGAGVHAYRSFALNALAPYSNITKLPGLQRFQIASRMWSPVANMQLSAEINNVYGHYTADKSIRPKDDEFWSGKSFLNRQVQNAKTAAWMFPAQNFMRYIPSAKKQWARDYSVFAGFNAATTTLEHFVENGFDKDWNYIGGQTQISEDYTTKNVGEAIFYRLMGSFWMDAKAAKGGFQHAGAKRRTLDDIMRPTPPSAKSGERGRGTITQEERSDYQVGTSLISVSQKGLDTRTPGMNRALRVLLENNGLGNNRKMLDGAWAKIQEAREGDKWQRNKSIAEVVHDYARDQAKAERDAFYQIPTTEAVVDSLHKGRSSASERRGVEFYLGMETQNLSRRFNPVLMMVAQTPMVDASLGHERNVSGFFRLRNGTSLQGAPRASQIKPEHVQAFVAEFQPYRRNNPKATLGDYVLAFKRKHAYEGYRTGDQLVPRYIRNLPQDARDAYGWVRGNATTVTDGGPIVSPLFVTPE